MPEIPRGTRLVFTLNPQGGRLGYIHVLARFLGLPVLPLATPSYSQRQWVPFPRTLVQLARRRTVITKILARPQRNQIKGKWAAALLQRLATSVCASAFAGHSLTTASPSF